MSLPNNSNFHTTIDNISDLPNEMFLIIFSHLPSTTLLECKRVSKLWKQIADSKEIWKTKFQDQKYWEYHNDDSETDSWYELYKERHLLESNWKHGRFTKNKLIGHDNETFCVKFYKNWILTGSVDYRIRIWDSETFQCLRVIGEPNIEFLLQLGVDLGIVYIEQFSDNDILELKENIDFNFHLDLVSCMDINDKYLVSGSWDGTCIIRNLPDMELIDRLIIPNDRDSFSSVYSLALYNDYIVCCSHFITVWKSSLDNLEDQPRFNLQHTFKGDGQRWISGFCIDNGIIYCWEDRIIRSMNIETGQIIQEFRYDHITCITIKDQYLFVGQRERLTSLDLHTNETNLLSYEGTDVASEETYYEALFIVDNKIISVNAHDGSSSTIKIWNLNDLKLFKVFINDEEEDLEQEHLAIDSDSKKLVAFKVGGDAVVYDFTGNLRKKYLKYI